MAKRENISVSFTPEQASFLSACVGSGRYQSTSEAVREAELNSLRDKIAAGAAELNAGRVVDGERFFAEWDQEKDRKALIEAKGGACRLRIEELLEEQRANAD